jgi:hypothetical protein
MQWRGVDELDITSTGLPPAGTADISGAVQLVWPTPTSSNSAVATYPVLVQTDGAFTRLMGDYCRVDLIGQSASALIGDYVDIARFGSL